MRGAEVAEFSETRQAPFADEARNCVGGMLGQYPASRIPLLGPGDYLGKV